jgi:hypothetical protein
MHSAREVDRNSDGFYCPNARLIPPTKTRLAPCDRRSPKRLLAGRARFLAPRSLPQRPLT